MASRNLEMGTGKVCELKGGHTVGGESLRSTRKGYGEPRNPGEKTGGES